MPIVSITRFRTRAIWFVPMFMYHAQRSISQIRSARGCISLTLLRDRSRVFWTMTVWEDKCSMKEYINRGSHREAMPHLADWADEASVVHWHQDHAERPDWNEAVRRMKAEGRPTKISYPNLNHHELSFQTPLKPSDALFERF